MSVSTTYSPFLNRFFDGVKETLNLLPANTKRCAVESVVISTSLTFIFGGTTMAALGASAALAATASLVFAATNIVFSKLAEAQTGSSNRQPWYYMIPRFAISFAAANVVGGAYFARRIDIYASTVLVSVLQLICRGFDDLPSNRSATVLVLA